MSKQSKRKARRHKSKRSYHGGRGGPRPHYSSREPLPPAPLHAPTKPLSNAERTKLHAAIRENLDLDALGLDARSPVSHLGVGLYLGDERIGTINPGTARVGTRLATGDFLSQDAPWSRVYGNLAESIEPEPRVDAPPPIDNVKTVVGFPEGTDAEILASAAAASETIRTRFREYPVPLRLETSPPLYTLTFWPAEEIAGILCVPFVFARAGRRDFVGRLCPRHRGDVLPIQVSPAADDHELCTAWRVALSDMAKLLTDADGAHRDGSGTRTAATGSANVPGHKRRLPKGQHGREEARRLAAFFGVQLAEGETWVRPYARGNPIDGTVSLRWTPSIDLDGPNTRQAA